MIMASKIEITKAEVDKIVAELNAEKTNIDGDGKKLNSELEAINKAWEGTDAVAYTAKMKDDYGFLLEKFSESLQSYADFLGGVYGEYEKLDNTYVSKTIEV